MEYQPKPRLWKILTHKEMMARLLVRPRLRQLVEAKEAMKTYTASRFLCFVGKKELLKSPKVDTIKLST